MTNRNDGRSVVYFDTNSLHYLDLFVRYVQDSGYTVNDIGSEALARQLEQVDEVGYRKSLQKGRRIKSTTRSGQARYEAIQRHLEDLTAGSLPVARDCNQL